MSKTIFTLEELQKDFPKLDELDNEDLKKVFFIFIDGEKFDSAQRVFNDGIAKKLPKKNSLEYVEFFSECQEKYRARNKLDENYDKLYTAIKDEVERHYVNEIKADQYPNEAQIVGYLQVCKKIGSLEIFKQFFTKFHEILPQALIDNPQLARFILSSFNEIAHSADQSAEYYVIAGKVSELCEISTIVEVDPITRIQKGLEGSINPRAFQAVVGIFKTHGIDIGNDEVAGCAHNPKEQCFSAVDFDYGNALLYPSGEQANYGKFSVKKEEIAKWFSRGKNEALDLFLRQETVYKSLLQMREVFGEDYKGYGYLEEQLKIAYDKGSDIATKKEAFKHIRARLMNAHLQKLTHNKFDYTTDLLRAFKADGSFDENLFQVSIADGVVTQALAKTIAYDSSAPDADFEEILNDRVIAVFQELHSFEVDRLNNIESDYTKGDEVLYRGLYYPGIKFDDVKKELAKSHIGKTPILKITQDVGSYHILPERRANQLERTQRLSYGVTATTPSIAVATKYASSQSYSTEGQKEEGLIYEIRPKAGKRLVASSQRYLELDFAAIDPSEIFAVHRISTKLVSKDYSYYREASIAESYFNPYFEGTNREPSLLSRQVTYDAHELDNLVKGGIRDKQAEEVELVKGRFKFVEGAGAGSQAAKDYPSYKTKYQRIVVPAKDKPPAEPAAGEASSVNSKSPPPPPPPPPLPPLTSSSAAKAPEVSAATPAASANKKDGLGLSNINEKYLAAKGDTRGIARLLDKKVVGENHVIVDAGGSAFVGSEGVLSGANISGAIYKITNARPKIAEDKRAKMAQGDIIYAADGLVTKIEPTGAILNLEPPIGKTAEKASPIIHCYGPVYNQEKSEQFTKDFKQTFFNIFKIWQDNPEIMDKDINIPLISFGIFGGKNLGDQYYDVLVAAMEDAVLENFSEDKRAAIFKKINILPYDKDQVTSLNKAVEKRAAERAKIKTLDKDLPAPAAPKDEQEIIARVVEVLRVQHEEILSEDAKTEGVKKSEIAAEIKGGGGKQPSKAVIIGQARHLGEITQARSMIDKFYSNEGYEAAVADGEKKVIALTNYGDSIGGHWEFVKKEGDSYPQTSISGAGLACGAFSVMRILGEVCLEDATKFCDDNANLTEEEKTAIKKALTEKQDLTSSPKTARKFVFEIVKAQIESDEKVTNKVDKIRNAQLDITTRQIEQENLRRAFEKFNIKFLEFGDIVEQDTNFEEFCERYFDVDKHHQAFTETSLENMRELKLYLEDYDQVILEKIFQEKFKNKASRTSLLKESKAPEAKPAGPEDYKVVLEGILSSQEFIYETYFKNGVDALEIKGSEISVSLDSSIFPTQKTITETYRQTISVDQCKKLYAELAKNVSYMAKYNLCLQEYLKAFGCNLEVEGKFIPDNKSTINALHSSSNSMDRLRHILESMLALSDAKIAEGALSSNSQDKMREQLFNFIDALGADETAKEEIINRVGKDNFEKLKKIVEAAKAESEAKKLEQDFLKKMKEKHTFIDVNDDKANISIFDLSDDLGEEGFYKGELKSDKFPQFIFPTAAGLKESGKGIAEKRCYQMLAADETYAKAYFENVKKYLKYCGYDCDKDPAFADAAQLFKNKPERFAEVVQSVIELTDENKRLLSVFDKDHQDKLLRDLQDFATATKQTENEVGAQYKPAFKELGKIVAGFLPLPAKVPAGSSSVSSSVMAPPPPPPPPPLPSSVSAPSSSLAPPASSASVPPASAAVSAPPVKVERKIELAVNLQAAGHVDKKDMQRPPIVAQGTKLYINKDDKTKTEVGGDGVYYEVVKEGGVDKAKFFTQAEAAADPTKTKKSWREEAMKYYRGQENEIPKPAVQAISVIALSNKEKAHSGGRAGG